MHRAAQAALVPVLCLVLLSSASAARALVTPTPLQMTFLEWRMTAFVHFSITTFTGSQAGNQDPSRFAPDPQRLSPAQWCETAAAMGAPVAVLTAKHEAGYILWNTSEPIGRGFSIAESSTVAGRDLVAEFTSACRRVGVQPGLYFTTTDAYQTYRNISASVRRAAQLQQITELATGYGNISYFWFDHHAVESPADLWFAIDEVVRTHQPQAVVLGLDTGQIGGESGFAPYPFWYTCDTQDGSAHGRCLTNQSTGAPGGGGHFWKSWESDCSIYQGCHPWFWSAHAPVQSLAQSIGHWEATVGRGVEFIMNVPPNTTGLIDQGLGQATAAFGSEVLRRYGRYGRYQPTPPPSEASNGTQVGPRVTGTLHAGQTLVLPLLGVGKATHAHASTVESVAAAAAVDRIWVEEVDLATSGQRVAKYSLEYQPQAGGDWTAIALSPSTGGSTVGIRHVDVLSPALPGTAAAVRFTLLETLDGGGDSVTVALMAFATGASAS